MKKILSFILVLAFVLPITGCKTKIEKEKFTDYSFECFDTVTTIIGFEKDEKTFKKNAELIKSWLLEYHKLYDIYTVYDSITNLNTLNNSQGKEIKVDSKIIDLLEYSKSLYSKTDGEFNIAMGSVLSIWHNYRQNGIKYPENAELPPAHILKTASKYTDIDNIIINKEKSTVLINDKNLKIDVGGIAKGYATDMVAKKMEEYGIDGYLLNVGGNIKTVGKRYDKTKWTVGIENPDRYSAQAFVETLSLENISLVTSGSYQRFYTVNGQNYHHIIDSDTLLPAEYFTSVSVLNEDSGLADALSTALFCMPYEDGLKLIEQFSSTEALWVKKDGTKLYSKGFKEYITS